MRNITIASFSTYRNIATHLMRLLSFSFYYFKRKTRIDVWMTFVANASIVIMIYFCKQFEKSVYQSWNEAWFSNFCEGKHGAGVRNFMSNLSILPQNTILMRVKTESVFTLKFNCFTLIGGGGGIMHSCIKTLCTHVKNIMHSCKGPLNTARLPSS